MPLRARIRADACPPNDVTQGATGAAAPVVHLASLKGQGFGRLLEHALETFVFATLLDRPYVLDIRSRDPAFTWRSFFTHGDYNWRVPGWMEPLIEQAGNEVVPYGGADVRDGGAGLPDGWFFPGASELERANATRMEELVTREWAGGGPRGAQYALVPNWGTSTWFLAKGVRKMVWELMAQHRCAGISEGGHAPPGYGRWYGMAFLFKPTVLAWEVYRRDKADVLGEGFGDDTPFGAIHLRTENKHGLVQLRDGEGPEELRNFRLDVSWANRKEEVPPQIVASMARDLAACFRAGVAGGVAKWWLLSDSSVLATALAAAPELRDRVVQGYHANYSLTNTHSNNPAAKGLFGQPFMASAVSDWMAIWDAAVTFVGTGSAYGMTAAVGTGKACGCPALNPPKLPATLERCESARQTAFECKVGRSELLMCGRRGRYEPAF